MGGYSKDADIFLRILFRPSILTNLGMGQGKFGNYFQ